jgi:hypothetical protein
MRESPRACMESGKTKTAEDEDGKVEITRRQPMRGRSRCLRAEPVSEGRADIRGKSRCQRTEPMSEDRADVRGQSRCQRTVPMSEDSADV